MKAFTSIGIQRWPHKVNKIGGGGGMELFVQQINLHIKMFFHDFLENKVIDDTLKC
jgi:hypothetical protein